MKRALSCMLFVLAAACLMLGQIGGTAASPALTNQSSYYGQWVVHSLNTVASGAATITVDNCYVRVGLGNRMVFPFATNAAVTIIDGANTETVTPSAVATPTAAGPGSSTVNPYSCSFTATLSNAHNAGVSIISGDAGVAEAANDNGFAYGVFAGADILAGGCTGTATASSTLGVQGLGTFAIGTCTSTVVSAGRVMNRSVLIKNLSVSAGTGGVGAGSGVFTVVKNGSTTSITCTMGTGTSCSDTTHTVSAVAGDIIGLQFTTAASETLANVKATLLAY